MAELRLEIPVSSFILVKRVLPERGGLAMPDFMKVCVEGVQVAHADWGRAKADAPKVTEPNLRFPAVFCENLWFSAKICGFLRKSCALQMLEFPGEGANLQKSAVLCENLRFGLSLSS